MKNFLFKTFASSRALSLYWRTADMIVAGFADIILNNLQLYDLPNGVTVMIGLILGEITKYFNKKSKQ